MALPSAVTLGSLAFVVVAGIGFVAVTSAAGEKPSAQSKPAADTTTKSGKDTPAKHEAHKPTKDAHRRTPPLDAVPKTFVEVYNNAGVSGLAASKAKLLEDAGWNVAATDNWYGNIPANTVYYPAKLESNAKQLAKLLHITRLRPAVLPMQFDRLTVIFTSTR
jgi:hypothetical protein